MGIKKAIIIAAFVLTFFILYSIRPLLTDFFKIAWPVQLVLISVVLLIITIIIGYPFCYAFLGPRLMAKRGKRQLSENYTYFGNILQMENDLKELAKQNDQEAIQILKIINICKWTMIITLISSVVFAVISSVS